MMVRLRCDWAHVWPKHDLQSKPGLLSIDIKKKYFVISVEGPFYRILDDHEDPVLFPVQVFDILDNRVSMDWVLAFDSCDEIMLVPKELSAKYFFDDYHDGVSEIKSEFLEWLAKRRQRCQDE